MSADAPDPHHPAHHPHRPLQLPGYAHWGKRVAAYLVDGLLVMLLTIPLFVGVALASGETRVRFNTGTSRYESVTTGDNPFGWVLVLIGLVLVTGFFLWNHVFRQGRTGRTVGKSVLGITLVGARDGRPIGPGMSFVRQLAHVLDQLPCYLGFLWPLWDPRRQTFADKLLDSVVVDQPRR